MADDPIVFTPSGELLNGQTRLEALVLAGMSFEFTVSSDVEPGALSTTWETFAPSAGDTLTGAQSSAETLTASYLGEPVIDSLAGTTEVGATPTNVYASLLDRLYESIRSGAGLAEVLALGQYLATRVTDNEISRVTDTTFERLGRGKAKAWRGITHGPSDECVRNAGIHSFAEPMFRHPGCRCERVVVTEQGAQLTETGAGRITVQSVPLSSVGVLSDAERSDLLAQIAAASAPVTA